MAGKASVEMDLPATNTFLNKEFFSAGTANFAIIKFVSDDTAMPNGY